MSLLKFMTPAMSYRLSHNFPQFDARKSQVCLFFDPGKVSDGIVLVREIGKRLAAQVAEINS